MKFHAIVSPDKKFAFAGSRQWVLMKLSELPPGEYDVVVTKHFKKRSLSQNAYYWAVVVEMVYLGLRDAGFDDVQDRGDAHEILKGMFFTKTHHSEQHDNLVQVMSTTKYSTSEFAEKMEDITRWAFEYLGVTIPPPGSQTALEFTEQKAPY